MKKTITIILCLFLSACAGGLNCPLDTPSCCYDNLFGCGTFDLPFGCECSDYGFDGPEEARALSSSPVNWRGTLQLVSSTCGALKPSLSGTLQIYESRNSVKIVVPGYGTLTGKGSATKGSVLSGRYTPPLTGCQANISGLYKRSSVRNSKLSVQIRYKCGVTTCVGNYRGSFSRA